VKFLDPEQPGQITNAIAEAVIDVVSILATNFPAFYVRVRQGKCAHAVHFASKK